MKIKTLFIISLLLFICVVTVPGLDKEIVLGRGDYWQDFPEVSNLVLKPGKWGTRDFLLRDDEYNSSADTDLLLHFNQQSTGDETGSYEIIRKNMILSDRVYTFGGASAGFTSFKHGISLIPGQNALFKPDTYWNDFSIEFWLYPAHLSDGEIVWSWVGSRWQGNRVVPQKACCTIQRRKLKWEFENIFISTEQKASIISIAGLTPLIPRVWHHHILRYDSKYGILEYLVDGVPEAVVYTISSSREKGTLPLPYIGTAGTGNLEIGYNFTGFMDEFRILKSIEEKPVLTRYSGRTGTAVSRIFDLGYTGTRIKQVEAVYDIPSDSEVYFFYKVADDLESRSRLSAPWKQFIPNESFTGIRGRYIQVMFELFPDGKGGRSPQVSELRIIYEQDLPPAPPAALHAVAGNQMVRLAWNHVNEEDVRGYLIYYGDRPGNYHGKDSKLGPSPIDAGNVSSIDITGLENGKLYYFTAAAYDSTMPPHMSLFSREISSRPSPLESY